MSPSSLYAQYIYEREGFEIAEIPDKAFGSYVINNTECFIKDLFVSKPYRNSNLGSEIVTVITSVAKQHGCSILSCTASPYTKISRGSILFILKQGFRPVKSDSELVYFIKDI